MRYPSESIERMDQQWADTEAERNERLRRKRQLREHEVVRHSDGTQFVPTEDGYVQIDP